MYRHIQPFYKINSCDIEVKVQVPGRSSFSILAGKYNLSCKENRLEYRLGS